MKEFKSFYEKAAKLNQADSSTDLGCHYEQIGDFNRAKIYYKEAIKNDCARAYNNLGINFLMIINDFLKFNFILKNLLYNFNFE